jgi:hypothetical protein
MNQAVDIQQAVLKLKTPAPVDFWGAGLRNMPLDITCCSIACGRI